MKYQVWNTKTDRPVFSPFTDKTRANAVATDCNAGAGEWKYEVREVQD